MRRIAAALLAGGIAACGGAKSPASPTTPATPAGTPGVQAEPLRDAAGASGKLVGAAVKSGLLSDSRYAGVLGRHFNYLTAEFEMKWDAIERTRGVNVSHPGFARHAPGAPRRPEIGLQVDRRRLRRRTEMRRSDFLGIHRRLFLDRRAVWSR